eukprot:6168475-Pyramimonas_sp.AAC.1
MRFRRDAQAADVPGAAHVDVREGLATQVAQEVVPPRGRHRAPQILRVRAWLGLCGSLAHRRHSTLGTLSLIHI